MKVVSLLENTSTRSDMRTEHGLSLYIETGKHKILFDMGQSDAFAANADTLGVDLRAVGLAVLSHGHYDHGGGLAAFLERNSSAPVYLSRYAFEPHYHGEGRYIGLNPALRGSAQLHFTEGETRLGEGLTLCDCNRLSAAVSVLTSRTAAHNLHRRWPSRRTARKGTPAAVRKGTWPLARRVSRMDAPVRWFRRISGTSSIFLWKSTAGVSCSAAVRTKGFWRSCVGSARMYWLAASIFQGFRWMIL